MKTTTKDECTMCGGYSSGERRWSILLFGIRIWTKICHECPHCKGTGEEPKEEK